MPERDRYAGWSYPEAPGGPGGGRGGFVVEPGPGHHSIFVSGSILPAGFRFLRSLWNRVWLQYRQMTRTFSFTSCPPKLCSKMWSTSALLGCRLYS